MRHVVLLGLAHESEQRRAAGRPGAQIEGCARGGARAQAARASCSSRASISLAAISRRSMRRIACPWCSSPTARSTASSSSAARARSRRAARRPVIRARSALPLWVTMTTRSVSANEPCRLPVGIAGEAARAPATLDHSAAVGADRGVGRDRSGEPTDRFVADVAWCGAREQTDVAFRHAGGAQCLDRAARRELGGVCPGERGHGGVLRSEPCRRVCCADHARGRLRRICGALTAVAAHV